LVKLIQAKESMPEADKPCQPVAENGPASLKLRRTGSSWLQEDTSWRRQTSHGGK